MTRFTWTVFVNDQSVPFISGDPILGKGLDDPEPFRVRDAKKALCSLRFNCSLNEHWFAEGMTHLIFLSKVKVR